jgi:membrane protease YdiL (CAAX protease family)
MDWSPKRKVVAFVVLTALLSSIFYALIIRGGGLGAGGGLYVMALMWCPGVAAILVRLISQGNLRGMGWIPKGPAQLGLGYIIPVLYAAPVYLLVWGLGFGGFQTEHWGMLAADFNLPQTPASGLLVLATVGVAFSMITATGEEIGWRGLLVPELAKFTGFGGAALISGVIWTLYHAPLLIFSDYNSGTSVWYGMACFAVMAIAISVVMAWLTLWSGSLWPAALMHASHNLFIQGVLDTATVDRGITKWLTTEFGVGLAVTSVLAAAVAWRMAARQGLGRPAT